MLLNENIFLRQLQGFENQKLLVAVSGGVDSVVLAHLMHSAGLSFAIAHCNFHLRPGDCDSDELFVRRLAEQYGVPIFVAQFDTAAFAQSHHLCIEDAARRLRYDFFHQLRLQHSFAAILTAHHRDDSTETFFLNLLRGTGLSGLHGILPYQGHILRPLLPFGREDIEAYAAENHLAHVEDSTNSSLDYRRNQIRHQLLPLLRELYPSADKTLQLTILNLQSVEALYFSLLEPLRQQLVKPLDDGGVRISLHFPYPEHAHQILFELLRPYGFNASQVADILSASQSGRKFLSATHQVLLDRQCLLVYSKEKNAQEGRGEPSVAVELLSPADIQHLDLKHLPPNVAYFDASKVQQPFSLRHWSEGDRFQPYGMERGTQLLSDYFSDHKFTLLDKQQQLLLTDATGSILWLVSRRTAHFCRITPTTSSILKVIIR